MTRGTLTPSDPERSEEPYRPFVAVREELLSTPADDLARQLPNLVPTVIEVSKREDTDGLLLGVSFTRDHTPLDYELDRIVERADQYHREPVKEAISGDHRYLRFHYPPDPQFTATTLRGALLSAVEEEIHGHGDASESEDATTEDTSRIASLVAGLRALF